MTAPKIQSRPDEDLRGSIFAQVCDNQPHAGASDASVSAQPNLSAFGGDSHLDISPPDGLELSVVCLPIVRSAAVAVHSQLGALATRGIVARSARNTIFKDLLDTLWHSLFTIVSRSMVVELAAAKSTGLLHGETEAERYGFFVECLVDEDFALPILDACPALKTLVEISSQNWLEATGCLLKALADDQTLLKDHFFNGSAPGAVNRIDLSQGDRHRNGRSVAIVETMSGQKLVYKPRSLAADIGFVQFADWINATSKERLLAPVSSLNCGDHGWCAFVEHQPVHTQADLEIYHFRLGALLAVARILGLSDLHAENLIAAGAWPTIVDLETLFHPPLRKLKSRAPDTPAGGRLREILDRSVLASGLLPIRAKYGTSDTIDLDLAGMSDSAGQETPFETPRWENTGTDDMALGFAKQTLDGSANVPVLNGRRMAPESFTEHVLAGFRRAYELLQDNKKLLLSEDGPLAPFTDAPVRIVFRPTQYYSALLLDGSHPSILDSEAHKTNWLRQALHDPITSSPLDSLIDSEIVGLLRQDVPYFETVPHSREIRACDGIVRPNFLPESGFEGARKIISDLSPRDLVRQSWLITVSLTKAEPDRNATLAAPEILACRPQNLPLEIAHMTARQVMGSAILSRGHANWMTAQEAHNGTLSCKPAGLDLYGGLPGIALFMTCAGSVLGCRDYTECGKAALREILDILDAEGSTPRGIGGYSGLGGLIYALDRTRHSCPDLPLTLTAHQLLQSLDLSAPKNIPLEMIDGMAGLISCLSAMQQADPMAGPTVSLVRCCHAVLQKLESMECGHCEDPILSQPGAAHGTAGLIGALSGLRLHGVPELSRLADAALSELPRPRFENSRSGPDFAGTHRIAWCNGLTGFLANDNTGARPDNRLLKALLSGLGEETYGDDSLCHGSMGAILVLNTLKPECTEDRQEEIGQVSAEVLGRIRRRGPRCGTIDGVPTPGLMDGLAGIGLAALFLIDPASVPRVPGLQSAWPAPTDRPRTVRP